MTTATTLTTTIEELKTAADKIAGKPAKTTVDPAFTESKAYKAAVKHCGEDFVKELLAKDVDGLKAVISNNTLRINEATEKALSTTEYLKAKDVTDTIKGGLKSTVDPWKSALKLCVKAIESRTPAKS